jgi:N-acetylmuramoyl-L-alanine amidase
MMAVTGAGIGAVVGLRRWMIDYLPTDEPLIPPLLSLPHIISRAEWDARQPNHDAPEEKGYTTDPSESEWYTYPGSLADAYSTVVIHHSSAMLSSGETMLSIQAIHMDSNGWADIAYHYGIDHDGLIYEGRDIRARGASVAGHNTGTIGVVVMGNFEFDYPLAGQLTALQTLVNWLATTYTLTHLAGHGEFNPESVCPGQHLIEYLDTLARGAGLERGTGGYVAPE